MEFWPIWHSDSPAGINCSVTDRIRRTAVLRPGKKEESSMEDTTTLDRLPVGVDVELLRPAPRRLAGDLEDGAVFRLWTAREATVKRRGLGIGALVGGGPEPDPLCRPLEGFLPGYVVTVCPSREARVRTVFIENIAGR